MFDLESLMWYRQREFLREAEYQRLAHRARIESLMGKPRFSLALAQLGVALINWGARLQDRFGDSEMSPAPTRAHQRAD